MRKNSSMLALGIDIGGTKILGGIVNSRGDILIEKERPTDAAKGKEPLLDALIELIGELISGVDVDVIGIGCAGRIDIEQGSVYYATPNLPNWTGFPLKSFIERRFPFPVMVDNDVNVAGIGETWMGAGKDFSSVVCLTLGTGIAAAVFVDGKIVRGKHWSTGEVGHMILYPQGKPCNCGQFGCFEQYCSGSALYKNYNEEIGKTVISSGKEFFSILESGGDPYADAVLEKFIDDLAISFVSLSNIYDPEAFIIGGGLIDTARFWWDKLHERIQSFANPAVSQPVLLPATYKNRAGMLGAAKLGFDCLKERQS